MSADRARLRAGGRAIAEGRRRYLCSNGPPVERANRAWRDVSKPLARAAAPMLSELLAPLDIFHQARPQVLGPPPGSASSINQAIVLRDVEVYLSDLLRGGANAEQASAWAPMLTELRDHLRLRQRCLARCAAEAK